MEDVWLMFNFSVPLSLRSCLWSMKTLSTKPRTLMADCSLTVKNNLTRKKPCKFNKNYKTLIEWIKSAWASRIKFHTWYLRLLIFSHMHMKPKVFCRRICCVLVTWKWLHVFFIFCFGSDRRWSARLRKACLLSPLLLFHRPLWGKRNIFCYIYNQLLSCTVRAWLCHHCAPLLCTYSSVYLSAVIPGCQHQVLHCKSV